MKKPLIMFFGSSGCGKDTSAEFVKNYFLNKNLKVKIMSLGDKVKEFCCKILNVTSKNINIKDFYDEFEKEKERPELGFVDGDVFTLRRYMTKIGTDITFSVFNNDFWCEVLYKEFIKDYNNYDVFVIPDGRLEIDREYFKNLKEYECVSVKLFSDRKKVITGKNQQHFSETTWQKIKTDFEINNSFSKEVLYGNLKCIIDNIEINNI